MIYGSQLIASVHPRLINSSENSLMKVMSQSVGVYLPGFSRIAKTVHCFNALLEQIVIFID
jgi:hypothetical protein